MVPGEVESDARPPTGLAEDRHTLGVSTERLLGHTGNAALVTFLRYCPCVKRLPRIRFNAATL